MKLKFIHISKTGGTSIEDCFYENNIKIGRFDEILQKNNIHWHEPFINYPDKMKKKFDWFVVVRNPYEKILSEFYCNFTGIGLFLKIPIIGKKLYDIFDNSFFLNKIIKYMIKHSRYTKHCIEQYKYIDGKYNVNILRFEQLEDDFNKLMKKYNLNIKLNKYNNSSKKKLSITDISKKNIKLINKIYHKDFEIFNY